MQRETDSMSMRCFSNPQRHADTELARALCGVEASAAMRRIAASLPGQARTPLLPLRCIAEAAGVAEVEYKDEGRRCGLGNFKALGAVGAIYNVLADAVAAAHGERPSFEHLRSGRFADIVNDVRLVAATAGSHGKAVAWAASLFGCRSSIYVYEGVDQARERAIAALGAEVTRLPMSYDEAVDWVAGHARAEGFKLISDTASDSYTVVPLDIMRGYSRVAEEIVGAYSTRARPTHVLVQAGVGGLAAAICAYLADAWRDAPPLLVVVEPQGAACLLESASVGRLVDAPAPVRSAMIGLAAGRPSVVAWQILSGGADAFVAIGDEACGRERQRCLALEPSLAAAAPSLSAIAGLSALLSCVDQRSRTTLRLTPDSRVLTIGTDTEASSAPPSG